MSTHPSKKNLLTTGVGNPPRRQEVWRPSSTTRGIWCIKRVATSGALPLRQILWISWWTGPAEGAVTMGNAGRFWRSKYGDPKSVVQAGKDILDEMSKFSYITSLLYIYIYIYASKVLPDTLWIPQITQNISSEGTAGSMGQSITIHDGSTVNGTWKVDRWISFLGSRLWNIRREYGGWLSHGGTPSYPFIDGFSL